MPVRRSQPPGVIRRRRRPGPAAAVGMASQRPCLERISDAAVVSVDDLRRRAEHKRRRTDRRPPPGRPCADRVGEPPPEAGPTICAAPSELEPVPASRIAAVTARSAAAISAAIIAARSPIDVERQLHAAAPRASRPVARCRAPARPAPRRFRRRYRADRQGAGSRPRYAQVEAHRLRPEPRLRRTRRRIRSPGTTRTKTRVAAAGAYTAFRRGSDRRRAVDQPANAVIDRRRR